MEIVNETTETTRESKEEMYLYMKNNKNMTDEDITEVQMILSMMDEAITLLNMKKRI